MHRIKFPRAIDEAAFLQDYWQQRPLYMPQAWSSGDNPLSAEELAGLALEEGIPARIIEHHSDDRWTLQHGPFSTDDFARLEGSRWSLLITDIEKYLPDFRQYVEPFRFIPDWRFDDLMISYAPPGGSVGPHVDDYDVFLIQVEGHREWRLEEYKRALPMPEEELLPGTDLRLIRDFQTTQKYRCSPGDILYLPPRIGHYGVALDECMTWSIGFRAPSFNDMLAGYLEAFGEHNEHCRLSDPGPALQADPGEITLARLKQIKTWFINQVDVNDELFYRFIAGFLSEQSTQNEAIEPGAGDSPGVTAVETNPFVGFDFIRLQGQVLLYAGGEEFGVGVALARSLTSRRRIELAGLNQEERSLISVLLARGYLLPAEN